MRRTGAFEYFSFSCAHTCTHKYIQYMEIHTQKQQLLNNSVYTNTHWRQGEGESTGKPTGTPSGPQCQQPIGMELGGQRERFDPQ